VTICSFILFSLGTTLLGKTVEMLDLYSIMQKPLLQVFLKEQSHLEESGKQTTPFARKSQPFWQRTERLFSTIPLLLLFRKGGRMSLAGVMRKFVG
jgi:hypothetical protein